MTMRKGIGAVAAAVAVAAGSGIVWFGSSEARSGQAGAGQQAPPVRGLQEGTPRSRAAQEIAALLRQGVEADPQQVIAGLPKLGELAERRRQIAEQLMDFALVKFVQPPSPSAERGTFHAAIVDYMEWSSRRLDAALDLADSDDARREAMAREVAMVRRIEEIYRESARGEGVGITPQNLLELEFNRLELESRLARLVGEGAG